LAERLLPLRSRLIDAFGRVQARALLSRRIRCHGDYRLDQLPFTGNDFVVVDFEGDPRMSGGQRRIKRSPLARRGEFAVPRSNSGRFPKSETIAPRFFPVPRITELLKSLFQLALSRESRSGS